MKFRDYFSLKHFLFAIVLFALLIPIALWDSDTQVKVSFDNTAVYARSDRFSMTIAYDLIDTAALEPLAPSGEKLDDKAFDDDIIRTGNWVNDAWGEYTVCADPDTSVCIVAYLKDGRIFVFSQKNDEATEEAFRTLQNHLN